MRAASEATTNPAAEGVTGMAGAEVMVVVVLAVTGDLQTTDGVTDDQVHATTNQRTTTCTHAQAEPLGVSPLAVCRATSA